MQHNYSSFHEIQQVNVIGYARSTVQKNRQGGIALCTLTCLLLHVYYGDLAGPIEMLGTTLESEPLDPETAPETRHPGRKKPEVRDVQGMMFGKRSKATDPRN